MTLARPLMFLIVVVFAIGSARPLLALEANGYGPNGVVVLVSPPPGPGSSPALKHSPWPTPTPSPTPGVSTEISSPSSLRIVSDASDCAHHGGVAANCDNALAGGALVLTFNWKGTKRYAAADSFNVYEVDHGSRLLLDRIKSPSTVAIVTSGIGKSSECYAISAVVGKLESPMSTKYCGATMDYKWKYASGERCATQIVVTYGWADASPATQWNVVVWDAFNRNLVNFTHAGRGSLPTKTAIIDVPLSEHHPQNVNGQFLYRFSPTRAGMFWTGAGGGFFIANHRPCHKTGG